MVVSMSAITLPTSFMLTYRNPDMTSHLPSIILQVGPHPVGHWCRDLPVTCEGKGLEHYYCRRELAGHMVDWVCDACHPERFGGVGHLFPVCVFPGASILLYIVLDT